MDSQKTVVEDFGTTLCSASFEFGHLTQELIDLLPNEPLTIADSFGDSKCAIRLRQMIGAYGDIAGQAYIEACRFKYKESNQ